MQQKALGKALFNQVCETLNLIEVDYFGLEYLDQNGTKVRIFSYIFLVPAIRTLIFISYFLPHQINLNSTHLGLQYWLDKEKPIYRQLSLSLTNPLMYFGVKFYVPDPANLEDEFTR